MHDGNLSFYCSLVCLVHLFSKTRPTAPSRAKFNCFCSMGSSGGCGTSEEHLQQTSLAVSKGMSDKRDSFTRQLCILIVLCVCRSSLASVNTWRAPRDQPSSAPTISFDGTGYLFTEQLADFENFDSSVRILRVTTRPNEERDGLVLYAYDRDVRAKQTFRVV